MQGRAGLPCAGSQNALWLLSLVAVIANWNVLCPHTLSEACHGLQTSLPRQHDHKEVHKSPIPTPTLGGGV
eukprot:1134776-Pelagomonas_calceolata.AAC.3